jgi:dipeptidyl aminopeptidase/acylaminoacyl peptidase
MSSDEQLRAALRRPQRPAPDEAGAYERFLRRRTALRRRVQVSVAVGTVLLIVGGVVAVRLLPNAAPAVVAPAGPPAADTPRTFVGQLVSGTGKSQLAIIDVRSGRIVHRVPGWERWPAGTIPVAISPDLRSAYLMGRATSKLPCGSIPFQRVDLQSGATHPVFTRLAGLWYFTLSADGRSIAYVRMTDPNTTEPICPAELVVRDLATGRQRVWTIPHHGSILGMEFSPDGTRLLYSLELEGSRQRLHVLPLDGTTSVTQGRDLPQVGASPCPGAAMAQFMGSSDRLWIVQAQGCANGSRGPMIWMNPVLAEYDLGTGRVTSTTRLALPPTDALQMDVDRSGQNIIFVAASTTNALHPNGAVYALHDRHLRRLPFKGNIWRADW